MDYKVVEVNVNADPSVELRFVIAGARADGEELLRFDIPRSESKKEHNKYMSSLTKILKQMKDERLIQLYAMEKHFEGSTMEAEYLLNKYPTVFLCGHTDNAAADFIYVKL